MTSPVVYPLPPLSWWVTHFLILFQVDRRWETYESQWIGGDQEERNLWVGSVGETSQWSLKISILFSFYWKKKQVSPVFLVQIGNGSDWRIVGVFIDRDVYTIPNTPVQNVVRPLPSKCVCVSFYLLRLPIWTDYCISAEIWQHRRNRSVTPSGPRLQYSTETQGGK